MIMNGLNMIPQIASVILKNISWYDLENMSSFVKTLFWLSLEYNLNMKMKMLCNNHFYKNIKMQNK